MSPSAGHLLPAAGLGINVANMSGSADITLPDTIFAGLNFNVTKTWSVGGGVYWTGWQYFDKLQLNFGAPFGGNAVTAGPSTTSITPKNWANVARYLIGTEWKATPNWDLRLGYAYDVAPEPQNTLDYLLPDNDRHMPSIGVGYHQGTWSMDLSYTYMIIIDRSYPGGAPTGRRERGCLHLPGKTYERHGSPDRTDLRLQVLNIVPRKSPDPIRAFFRIKRQATGIRRQDWMK